MKQQRLGKGLGALIGEETGGGANSVIEIDVNDIDPNSEQPRKIFNDEKLSELAQSIDAYGIVQPIIVQKKGQRYIIIAGERRYRAARIAGLRSVPAVIKEYSKRAFMEVSLIENLQREDLNPIEEAEAMRLLMDEHELTQDELSSRIGKSRSAVANTLRLLSLPERVRDMVMAGDLSSGHARCLVSLDSDDEKIRAAQKIVSGGLSVRATEELIKAIGNAKQRDNSKEGATSPEIRSAESALSDILGTKVQIAGNLSKGKVLLSYYNQDQLQSLYDFLMTYQ
ncbi:MAG: ParB/RepB/Spo0J family partition protein [Eubacteriales bacterium]|nr:ParB/RepB/Spo0J family partition protein [Eubacteriales bacterium]